MIPYAACVSKFVSSTHEREIKRRIEVPTADIVILYIVYTYIIKRAEAT